MPDGRRDSWSFALLAVASLLSCAAPARRLSPRVVEDSIVLPRRMASVSAGGFVRWDRPAGTRTPDILVPGFRLGVTDRLEWTDLTSLTYAFLDDAPASARPARLSLAVQVGAPFGFSSVDGFVVAPFISLETLKHLSNLWALSLSTTAFGAWVENPSGDQLFGTTLVPNHRRWGGLDVSAGAQRQLVERVAVVVSGGVEQLQECFAVVCEGTVQGGRVSVGLSWRPSHWLTLGAWSSLGGRYRYHPSAKPQDPTDLLQAPAPSSVSWIIGTGWAAFYW